MGITLSAIHIYSEKPVTLSQFPLYSFSEHWYTVLPVEQENTYLQVKKIVKETNQPVLWFYCFDSDTIAFRLFANGRQVAYYDEAVRQSKGIFQIPALIGLESGNKRRLSAILSCFDFEQKIAMLEEFFGVFLLTFPELTEERPEVLRRARGDVLYRAYREEMKQLEGKHSPIRAELVFETPGKLFSFDYRQGYAHFLSAALQRGDYFFGFDTPESEKTGGNVRAVRFQNGALVPIPAEEIRCKPENTPSCERYTVEYGAKNAVTGAENAPKAYIGKKITLPSGVYPFEFDAKGRLLVYLSVSKLGVLDTDGKLIATFSVKGDAIELDGEYILTQEAPCYVAMNEYHPKQFVRIYRIIG